MKKDDPNPTLVTAHENGISAPRPALVTWQEDAARIERARAERVRQNRSIYIPPFPVQAESRPAALRWRDEVPAGLKTFN